jgi:hypothetical protein
MKCGGYGLSFASWLAGTLLAALMYFNPDGSRKTTPSTIQNPHR